MVVAALNALEVVDARDIRMSHLRHRLELGLEQAERRLAHGVGSDALHCQSALRVLAVDRAIDDAHAALAKQRAELVAAVEHYQ
jgi:hypothetical protein